MKPVFVINSLSETVANKGSKLSPLSDEAHSVFDTDIFDNLDSIVAAGRDSGWVIIEGGDGTAQGVLSAFFNTLNAAENLPKFTLLPGGMTNQVAKNIGLKPFTPRSLKSLLKDPKREVQTPLLRISSQGYPDLFGFLFSTGGVPMVTEYTKQKLHSKGIGGSAAVVGGIIKGISGRDETVLHPTQIDLQIDEAKISGPHLGTIVTTLPSLILGLDPFWGTGEAPLRLTYVDGQPKHLATNVAGLWLGRKNKDRSRDGLYSYCAKTLTYQYDGPIVLDGETLSINRTFSVSATEAVSFVT